MTCRLAIGGALLAVLAGAGCGHAASSHPAADRAAARAGYVIGDADNDDAQPGHQPADADDRAARGFGRPASAGQRRAIANALKRYYAAAAVGDAARVCALLDPVLASRPAEKLAELLRPELRPAPGSSVLGGRGCPRIESLLLAVNRSQLQTEQATLRLGEARVEGAEALAILRFKAIDERQIALRQRGGRWTVAALTDSIMP